MHETICIHLKKNDVEPNTFYKNWSGSSHAMESDSVLSGFLEAEAVHVWERFTKLVADGDM